MNTDTEVRAGPVVKVSRDLTAIADLYEALLAQAIHKANDQLMPGGEAMVALAHVGSPDEWSELIAGAEFYHLAKCGRLDHTRCRFAEHVADEDGQEAPLQTLLFWSEAWRTAFGYKIERRATMASEVGFIRGSLNWAWENEAQWDDFAADVGQVKTRLENLLYAGERAERGVPCLYDECRGIRLVRKLAPYSEGGQKMWRTTDWHCPRCKRSWDGDRYAAMVTAANEAAKVETIDGERWVATEYAARGVKRSAKTIRTWVLRGHVATVCVIRGRRSGFVRLSDVEEQDARAKRRGKAA